MTTLPVENTARLTIARRVEAATSRPAVWVGFVVVASVITRLAAAWQHTTPRYFPDEYIYPTVARSLATGAGLTVRGTPAHFPALLESLLTAPIWLFAGTEAAYRLTQSLHVVAMSLAAVPVYLLARRLEIPPWQAVACAAFTAALPSLIFSSYMTADAVAYPLALTAVAIGVSAIDRPTRVNQGAFVAAAGFATFARVQYVVIPAAFVFAAIILERGHLVVAARRYLVAICLLSVPLVAATVAGPSRLLGYYHGILQFELDPTTLVHWVAVDALLLSYAAGIAIVPGAAAALALGLGRNAPRTHRAFASVTTSFTALLLAETALYAANGSARFQERYLIAVVPLLAVAFCAGLSRLPRGRRLSLVAATVLFVLTLRIPLAGYTVRDGKQDSPMLMAVAELERISSYGEAGLAIAVAATLLVAIAAAATMRPRLFGPVALVAAIVAVAGASLGATAYDRAITTRMEFTDSPNGSWTWIDDLQLGRASLLVTPGANRATAQARLFWNRSVATVLRMDRAPELDVFGDAPAAIGRSGALTADGNPVRGPLVVEQAYSLATLDDARLVAGTPGAAVWLPHADAHVSTLTVGRWVDGWIDQDTTVTVWPRATTPRSAVVELNFSLPPDAARAVIDVSSPGISRRIVVEPGGTTHLQVPVHAISSPVTVHLRGRAASMVDGRPVVARLAPPRLKPLPQ